MGCQGWLNFSKAVDNERRHYVKGIIADETPGIDGLIEMGKNKSYLAGMQHAATLPGLLIQDYEAEVTETLEILRTLDEVFEDE